MEHQSLQDSYGPPPTLSSLTIAKIIADGGDPNAEHHHHHHHHHHHQGSQPEQPDELNPIVELHGESGEQALEEDLEGTQENEHDHEHGHEHDPDADQDPDQDQDESNADELGSQIDDFYLDGVKGMSQEARNNYKKEMRKRKRQPEEWLKNVKKRQRATTHVTGEDCRCKRFKCFEERTTEEDRQVIISVFNNLADYNKQQAYLASLIEVGEVNTSQMGDKSDESPEKIQEEGEESAPHEPHQPHQPHEPHHQPHQPHQPHEPHQPHQPHQPHESHEPHEPHEPNEVEPVSTPVIAQPPGSDLGSGSSSKKRKAHTYSTKYYVKISNSRIRVCQKGFCSIFGITNKRVNLLASKLHKNGLGLPPTDMRGKHANRGTRYPPNPFPEQGYNPKIE